MKILRPIFFLPILALLFAPAIRAANASGSDKSKIENPKSKILKPYPLAVCIVTDNDLGSMGEETSIVYEGQVIKFCCKPCEAKFLKTPAKYLAKLAPAEPVKK